MRKFYKSIFTVLIALVLIISVPYIKTPGSCGLTLPFAFTGETSGYGEENVSGQKSHINEKSMASASEGKTEIKVTFVELGSESCMPCRMMEPVLEMVSKRYPGQVKVVYHDVMTDAGRSEGSKYRIRVIPTQVFLDNSGKEYFRHEGFFSFEEIDRVLRQKGVN